MLRVNEHRNYFQVRYFEERGKTFMTSVMKFITIATAEIPPDINMYRVTVDMLSQIEHAIMNHLDIPYCVINNIVYVKPTKEDIVRALKVKLHNPYIIPIDSRQVTLVYTRDN